MNNTELYFERPTLLFLLIPLFALLVGSFFFLPGRRRRSLRRIGALVLHCIVGAIVTLLISGIGLRGYSTKQAAVILVDRSLSMGSDPAVVNEGVKDLLDRFGEDIPAGVVAFGGDTAVELSIGEDGEIGSGKVIEDATDVESAVRYALTLLPDDSAKRVVLYSDGNETDGDARKAARVLQSMGVRVDTVYCPAGTLYEKEVQITSIEGAQSVNKGERLRMGVRIDAACDCRATLRITDNGSFVNFLELDLNKGENVVDVNVRAREEGSHVFTFRLESEDDTLPVNNVLTHAVTVNGDPKILLICETVTDGEELSDLLDDVASVVIRTPFRLQGCTIVDLCSYDGVIIDNVSKRLLPSYFDELLSTYVSRCGKPVLFIGGDRALSLGGMTGSSYEEMLPVSLDYMKAKTDRAVAIMLVIDCSRSMGNDNALALAKQSAIRCLETVSEEDYVGVISFCAEAEVVMRPGKCTASYKEKLRRAISGISIGAGTKYTQALELSLAEIQSVPAPVKHVIFLSDGQPSDNDYDEPAKELIDQGVTISTIGLRYDSSILWHIASIGLGRYNYVDSVDDLPEIMLSEAKLASTGPMVNGKFGVKITKANALTAGIKEEDVGKINGYIGTTPKEDATVLLTVNDDPLYAVRSLGRGTVAVFTGQLIGPWSSSWEGSTVCEDLVHRIVLASTDTSAPSSAISLKVEEGGKTARLLMETFTEDSAKAPEVIVKNGKNEQTAEVRQIGKNVFEAIVDTEEPGVYDVTLTLLDDEGEIDDFLSTTFTVRYGAEYNAFAGSGAGLMEDIAALTGGSALQFWEDSTPLSEVDMGTVTYTRSIALPLGIVAAVLYLIDVALRRIRPKQKKKTTAAEN